MEAKDVKWCPQHGYPLPCNKCGLGMSPTQQKEVFKAGMKDVVEWIKTHQLIEPDDNSLTRFEPFYQVEARELKEWGINEETKG